MESDHSIIDSFKLSGTKILQCSVDSFFELFYKDDAPLPFDKYWKDCVPTKNQKVGNWYYGNEKLPPDAKIDLAHKFDRS